MLSYQHGFHAGNLADVHKHALLAWTLGYLTRKDKPLTYIETHAGRALYDLSGTQAQKTGEAPKGIGRAAAWFPEGHPYAATLSRVRTDHGPSLYPGSPMIAANLLRATDRLHLAELHPQEHTALSTALHGTGAKVHHRDGYEMALLLCPPEPRRGLMLIDPSYEVKTDYDTLPRFIAKVTRAWNVGIVMLWYPILAKPVHSGMVNALARTHPDALRHEVHFAPSRPGHGMVGSGVFMINPPFGLDQETRLLSEHFAAL